MMLTTTLFLFILCNIEQGQFVSVHPKLLVVSYDAFRYEALYTYTNARTIFATLIVRLKIIFFLFFFLFLSDTITLIEMLPLL